MTNIFSAFRDTWDGREGETLLTTSDATLCFADVDNRSAALAGALLALANPAPGEVVMAVVEKSVDALALYLACLRLGVVFLPANPAYTPRELAHLADDGRPVILVCDPSALALAQHLSANTPSLRLIASLGTDSVGTLTQAASDTTPFTEVRPRSGEATAALLYTSGTTGAPKGVPLSHDNLLSNARALVDAWAFSDRDVLVHALPIFHVHGLFVALHCALLAGARMRYLMKFNAEAVRDALADATALMGVPTYYARLLTLDDFTRAHCANVRLFVSGSAPLTEKLFHAFEARTGQRILERYGMTETGMLASNPLHGERLAGSVGYALPGVQIRITGDGGETLPSDSPGMVEVRGPGIFAGYLNRPEVNAREFTADGWFRTGDLGTLAIDGRLTLAGRARDLVISGGYNVYPAEVEACLDTLDGVHESAVIGVPHDDLGEAVVAVVVPAAGAAPPSPESITAQLGERLARYKQPRHVEVVEALPRNTMGKVRKQALREALASHFQGRAD
ncbi:MAG: AMP-binding protein [Pseudomonadota bacterium]